MTERIPCINCGSPSTLLCDFTLGGVFAGYAENKGKPYRVQSIDVPAFTCDVPLCASCATHAGNVFFSGGNPSFDSVDYCPIHSHGNDGIPKPITEQESEVIRREIVAHYRRKSFSPVRSKSA